MLYGIFLVFFIMLNGRLTFEIAAVGALLCALTTVLAYRVLGWSRVKSRRLLRLTPDIFIYTAQLIWEILKANYAVIKIILSRDMRELSPKLFTLDSHLKSELARTALADSITITPGTYTVCTEGEVLRVHCLGEGFAFGDMELCFQKSLVDIEKKEALRNA